MSSDEHIWLRKIEDKVDAVLALVNDIRSNGCVQAPRHDDHEKRIRSLETMTYRALGGIAVLVFLVHVFWK